MDFLRCFLRTLMNELLSIGSGCRVNSSVRGSTVTTLLIGVLLVAALYFGREVLVPIALAILMSFVLAPLVGLLQRLYVPRIAAVLLVVLLPSLPCLRSGA
jgi:predicted PurR-regulated permease PerM